MNITNVLYFIVAMVFVVGGLVLMGYAFDAPEGAQIWLFSAGAIAEFIGVAIPALLGRKVVRGKSAQQ